MRKPFSSKLRRPKFKFLFRRYIPVTKKVLLISFLLSAFIFGYKYLATAQFFNIKNFKYDGVVKYVHNGDFENVVAAQVVGKNIFLFNTKSFEELLKKNFLGIKSVKVQKKYFGTINIQVQERVPTAIIIDKNGEKFLIDSDGYVLGFVDSYFDLPNVTYNNQLYVGQFIDKNIVPITMEILNRAKVENVQVSSLSVKTDYSVFYVQQTTAVYMSLEKSIEDGIKIVARLLASAKEEGKKIAKIDLRYDKVIVLYN